VTLFVKQRRLEIVLGYLLFRSSTSTATRFSWSYRPIYLFLLNTIQWVARSCVGRDLA